MNDDDRGNPTRDPIAAVAVVSGQVEQLRKLVFALYVEVVGADAMSRIAVFDQEQYAMATAYLERALQQVVTQQKPKHRADDAQSFGVLRVETPGE